MTDNSENKLTANELRKKGDIESALPLYLDLWEKNQDKFAAAGLIFCYRKQKRFKEALNLAEEAYSRFSSFDWCRNEYIWTLIQGKLYTFPEDGQLFDLITLVEKILEAKPDEIAYKITIFKLLKSAKRHGNWDILNDWITKIDPKILDGYTDEASGWTDKELWYYYRVNGLINTHKEDEALQMIENNKNDFYKQWRFFERLKAKANINLGNFGEAEASYKHLISSNKDWWLYHEYAKLLLKQNKAEVALTNYITAAMKPPMKLELKVSLYSDIGDILLTMNQVDAASTHFLLSKAIREEQGWSTRDLDDKLEQLKLDNKGKNLEIRILLNKCKVIWQSFTEVVKVLEKNYTQTKNLKGKVIKLNTGKPFCFIKTKDNQSYFCSKDDLPNELTEGQIVKFDLKPSFDKKKNEKTFQATNIQII